MYTVFYHMLVALWGSIEKVQLNFCKKELGVN